MIRFSRCECPTSNYNRIARRWWMALFGPRRPYKCMNCKTTLLLPPKTGRTRPGSLERRGDSALAPLSAAKDSRID